MPVEFVEVVVQIQIVMRFVMTLIHVLEIILMPVVFVMVMAHHAVEVMMVAVEENQQMAVS